MATVKTFKRHFPADSYNLDYYFSRQLENMNYGAFIPGGYVDPTTDEFKIHIISKKYCGHVGSYFKMWLIDFDDEDLRKITRATHLFNLEDVLHWLSEEIMNKFPGFADKQFPVECCLNFFHPIWIGVVVEETTCGMYDTVVENYIDHIKAVLQQYDIPVQIVS